MKVIFLLISVFAFEQLSNDLKNLIAIELTPFSAMKMRSLSPKMQKNRVYKIVKVWRSVYPFKVFKNTVTGGYLSTDKNGRLDMKFLDEQKFELEHADNLGRTPVWRAAAYGHLEIVKFLAGENVDLERADYDWKEQLKNTPVYIAAKNGHADIVKVLAEQKVDLERATDDWKTPVWAAANNGHTEIVKFLAGENVDLERADKDGRTPVWAAAARGCIEIVKYLAEQKVDLDRVDNDGRTPIQIAARLDYTKDHTEVVKFLIEENVKLDENLLESPVFPSKSNLMIIDALKNLNKESQTINNE